MDYWGGGAKGVCCPPQIIGGPLFLPLCIVMFIVINVLVSLHSESVTCLGDYYFGNICVSPVIYCFDNICVSPVIVIIFVDNTWLSPVSGLFVYVVFCI